MEVGYLQELYRSFKAHLGEPTSVDNQRSGTDPIPAFISSCIHLFSRSRHIAACVATMAATTATCVV